MSQEKVAQPQEQPEEADEPRRGFLKTALIVASGAAGSTLNIDCASDAGASHQGSGIGDDTTIQGMADLGMFLDSDLAGLSSEVKSLTRLQLHQAWEARLEDGGLGPLSDFSEEEVNSIRALFHAHETHGGQTARRFGFRTASRAYADSFSACCSCCPCCCNVAVDARRVRIA